MNSDKTQRTNLSRILLFGSGFLYLLCAIAYNEFVIGWIYPAPVLPEILIKSIRHGQINLLIAGLLFVLFAQYAFKAASLEKILRKRSVTAVLFLILLLAVPLSILELALGPYAAARKRTTHFMKDEALGWRLKPGAEYWWGGVHVRINEKGLRGPEIEYAKPLHTKRILFLGDSITFSHDLPLEQTFPHLTASALTQSGLFSVEVVNAAVEAYATWQEAAYLAAEGIRYEPDLVVVSFALDDVTEKFALKQFGGRMTGAPLENNVTSKSDEFLLKSGIVFFFKKSREYLSPEKRGSKQALKAESLIHCPDVQAVKEAWKITFDDLDQIRECCRKEGIPMLLAIFPLAYQLKKPGTFSAPQRTLGKFAREKGIPVIDLLPPMSEKMKEDGKRVGDYFMDVNHLTAEGSALVSKILTDFIQRERLLER